MPAQVEQGPVYDVLLGGALSDSLRSEYPRISVRATGAQTALRRRVSGPGQLDVLLEKLYSLGIHLVDVHRSPGAAGEADTYEVRVEGEVRQPVVGYLRWPHHVLPRQTWVRLAASSEELHNFLRACSAHGFTIEVVRRLEPVGLCHAVR